MRQIILFVCLLWATGCATEGTLGAPPPLDREFTLARGADTRIAETPLSLAFVRVTGDSRCPADAVCVLGGDATVHIRATRPGGTRDLALHTGDSARASATIENYRITLTDLQPYPFSSRAIDPDEYRATLRVSEEEE